MVQPEDQKNLVPNPNFQESQRITTHAGEMEEDGAEIPPPLLVRQNATVNLEVEDPVTPPPTIFQHIPNAPFRAIRVSPVRAPAPIPLLPTTEADRKMAELLIAAEDDRLLLQAENQVDLLAHNVTALREYMSANNGVFAYDAVIEMLHIMQQFNDTLQEIVQILRGRYPSRRTFERVEI